MQIIIATHNANKVKEMQHFLSEIIENATVITATEAGFTDEIEEDGTTFEENALIKARAVRKAGCISVADDSGLCVNALGGAPGVYSARYSGKNSNSQRNNEKLLNELKDTTDRSAYFMCAMACILPDGSEFTVNGIVEGEILSQTVGNGGFGYDPLFYYPPLNKTFAQLSGDEKHSVSHRGNALRLLKEELIKRLS